MVSDPEPWQRWRTNDLLQRLSDVSLVMAHGARDASTRETILRLYAYLGEATLNALKHVVEDPRFEIAIIAAERQIADAAEQLAEPAAMWAWNLGAMALGPGTLDARAVEVAFSHRTARDVILHSTKIKVPRKTLSSSAKLWIGEAGLYSERGPVALDWVPTFGGFQLATSEPELGPPAFLETIDEALDTCEKWSNVLQDAGAAVRRHKASDVLIAAFGRIIVPVRSAQENVHSSVSFATRPGVLYMSWCPRASVIAEAIVHESDHQLFYLLCRESPMWEQPSDQQPAIYRSPWRDDPRPLDGLLRGASAFVRVAEFWSALASSDARGLETLNWSCSRAVLAASQSLDALAVIGAHREELTQSGQATVQELESRGRAVLSSLSNAAQYNSWKGWADVQQERHSAAWRARSATTQGDRVLAP